MTGRFRALWPSGRWPLLLTLLALVVAWPLLHEPGLLNTRGGGDSPFLLQRLQQLTTALADGHFPVRWMPDANYGYGYPFYNYYAPLSLYIAAIFRFLGFSLTRALQMSQLAGFLVAAWGAFALARRWWPDDWVAFLTAMAYTTAPFHLVNIYVRGDSLAEFWAMAFYPLVLLAGERLLDMRQRGVSRLLPFALTYAGLIISHNVSAMIFSPFLLLYLGWRWLRRDGDRREPALWLGAGLLLALALSAWFWLPALGETALAQTGPITEGYFHYSAHFRDLNQVQTSFFFDYDVGGGRAFRMGLMQLLLALIGTAAWAWTGRRAGETLGWLPAGYALIIALGAGFMMSSLSAFLWDNLPLLAFTQFPWRFLSIQALGTALLTAGLARLPGQRYLIPAASLLLLTTALGQLRTVHLPLSDGQVDSAALAEYEWFTGNIGTTVSAEYLPATVNPRPQTSSWLIRGERDELTALDGEVAGQLVSRASTRQEWQLAVVKGPATIIFPTLYWPGWTAEVDGAPAEIGPAPGSGLIALPLAGDKHTVVLRLRHTLLRWTAELLSLVTLVGLVGWWGWQGRTVRLAWQPAGYGLLALLLLSLVGRLDRTLTDGPPQTTSWDFAQLGYRHSAPDGIPFADGSRLLSYTYEGVSLHPGELFLVTTAWELAAPGTTATLELVTPAASRPRLTRQVAPLVFAHDSQPIAAGANEFMLVIPGDVPPGLYLPRLTLTQTAGAIPALTTAGEPRGELYLAPIRIHPFVDRTPPAEYSEEPIPPPFRLAVNEVLLRPDNSLELHLAWLTTATQSQDFSVSLRLTDSDGNFLSQLDTAPGFGFLPSSRWPAGTWVNDWLALPLPAELPPEPTILTARLYEVATGDVVFTRRLGELARDGSFSANVPLYELPPLDHPVDVSFGELISLRGYTWVQTDDALLVTLYWQALAPIPDDYTHFVHLARPGEATPAAQHDAMPQNNNYPTSQWAEGEIVVDQLTIPLTGLAAGAYEIRVGLYRPVDGALPRLPAISSPDTELAGDQFILDATITIP